MVNMKMLRKDSSGLPENVAILHAFRFIEAIAEQIEALKKAIIEQLRSTNGPLQELRLESRNFQEGEGESENAGWIFRSSIDTFEIVHAKGKKKVFECAIQISLAPANDRADKMFVPHVAVLFGRADKCDPWKCEEFLLDDEHLRDSDKHEGCPWAPVSEWGWAANDGNWGALVVPLVELRDERDVKRLIVEPFAGELKKLL